jgi:hypothetical protein
MSMQKSNIASRTSSGSTEIGITWPTTHDQVSSSSKTLAMVAQQKAHVNFVSSESGDDSFPSASLWNGGGTPLSWDVVSYLMSLPNSGHHPKGEFTVASHLSLHLSLNFT